LARILIQGEQAERAFEHCVKALRYFEEGSLDRAHVFRMQGQIESIRQNLEAATALIQQAIDTYNSHQAFGELVKAYSLLGDIYKDKGQFKEAMECLENMNAAMEENLRERKIVI
jgi:tetratricopeptide (TPR) repeat protein